MSLSKEYGGYFELECGRSNPFHQGGVYLNSARNALRYIIRAYNIKKIALPSYTCPVVWHAVQEEGCHVTFYNVTPDLCPDLAGIGSEEYIVCNNYFGIRTNEIKKIAQKYSNIIVDNAQAFYAPSIGLASFYSPRKFFGLPDGGIAIGKSLRVLQLDRDKLSHERCSHLLKRHDLGANDGYRDFSNNDKSLEGLPVQHMSMLTQALMGNIDYDFVATQRQKNYAVLHSALSAHNLINADLGAGEVPLVYPFVIDKPGLREKLIENRIYTARYWPDIEQVAKNDINSLFLKDNLIALPIDQRYTEEDMRDILDFIQKLI